MFIFDSSLQACPGCCELAVWHYVQLPCVIILVFVIQCYSQAQLSYTPTAHWKKVLMSRQSYVCCADIAAAVKA
jgi:hypothetical protein